MNLRAIIKAVNKTSVTKDQSTKQGLNGPLEKGQIIRSLE